MSTSAVVESPQIEMGTLIRNGPRQLVPLDGRYLDPALVFAGGEESRRLQGYLALAAKIAGEDAWKATRTIFVTSPDSEDGRTSTAFNLGWALASRAEEGSLPVLVVELDLQQPSMRRMLGNPRIRYGIDCALREIASEEESTFTLVNERLHISAVRDRIPGNQARKVLRKAEPFLEWAAQEYAWVVVDCPPVLSKRWTKWHREHAKDVLLLVRSGWTPAVRVRRAAKRLGQALRGVVLNRSEGAE
ncbi:tyrosine-protein kinase family protein [Silvibacterium sp.]|uniref:tyrosine-protein kinase family protein n=1 Tax=Silvibacterium sp. TaxID=1964179 RepID=UPI0039E4368C